MKMLYKMGLIVAMISNAHSATVTKATITKKGQRIADTF
jgi:hypothetical protein